MSSK
ncbi:hypothetical protein GWI33_021601, partial [Rhynchophorus ferrugineus]|jgi:hypothetical protein